MNPLNDYLSFAITTVRKAGRIAAKSFRRPLSVLEKGPGDLVTKTDFAVDKHIISSIATEFPNHGIVSEESGERKPESEFVWILDPIDGTRYFVSGVPLYSISLALRQREELVMGVVFNPETNEMFAARQNGGASLNDAPIRCSKRTTLAESLLCVEIPNRHFPAETNRRAMEKVTLLVERADRVRIIGVSALGLCYCAAGGFDAYANLSGASKIWDVAAGQVILQEAGGTFTNLAGGRMIGGPPELHDELLELLG